MTLELFLSLWGAGLATVLAANVIITTIRDKSALSVSVAMVYDTARQGADTHGVLFRDHSSRNPIWLEADVEVFIRNRGRRSCQASHVFVDFAKCVFLVTPKPLPMVVEPHTMISVRIQPELLAMREAVENSRRNDSPNYTAPAALGILDALGRKYSVPPEQLHKAIGECQTLPLRYVEDESQEPGKVSYSVEMRDSGSFSNKGEEFTPQPQSQDPLPSNPSFRAAP